MLLTLVIAGCSGEHSWTPPVAPPWSIPWQPPPPLPPPSLTVVQLLAAPDSLVVDGMKISVQAFLDRDFMPFAPPEGRPLAAIVYLDGSPPGTFPPSASDFYIWAIRDSSEVWSATMAFQGLQNGARIYLAQGGPLWDPGILVDVVIGVRTSPTVVPRVLIRGVLIMKSF
jgi:hypothetical protein